MSARQDYSLEGPARVWCPILELFGGNGEIGAAADHGDRARQRQFIPVVMGVAQGEVGAEDRQEQFQQFGLPKDRQRRPAQPVQLGDEFVVREQMPGLPGGDG